MPAPPNGTITFLFTDIEGSTKLWECYRPRMQDALARHDTIMRQCIEGNGGYVFKTVGDAFCAAFQTAQDAMLAALDSQRYLADEDWDVPGGIRVRMALHTGACQEREGDYFGRPLNRIARLLSIGYGGQTLVSLVSSELLRDSLPDDVSLKDLGAHRLKDLIRPESVFQLNKKGLPADFAALKSLDNHPNNLPVQPNPFIGRERELESVRSLLADQGVRVLTLTGMGGTGKTRLSVQVAADAIDEFPDGVFFVDLAAIDQAVYVYPAIARTMGLRESGARTYKDLLVDALREKRLLLILDNFEQIISATSLVSELLAACPLVKFLITSREALRIRAERVFHVPALRFPRSIKFIEKNLVKLAQYDAVALFLERAVAVNADFTATNDNAPAIAEICVRLDGLPLAIELAAARLDLFSPQAILQRLGNMLGLLTRGSTDLPFRQRTLRAAIDWSYRLLDPEEQMLFREMSVFAGGFTMEALEELCACGGMGRTDVLGNLASLVSKSLLSKSERPGGTDRFSLSEVLKEYALELLHYAGEDEALKSAHTEYYLAFSDKASLQLDGPHQHLALDVLEEEHDNLRAAFEHMAGKEYGEGMQSLCGALRLFWLMRGHLEEGKAFCMRSLGKATDPSVRASALLCAGSLARATGDYRYALEVLELAIGGYKDAGDDDGLGQALYESGMTLFRQGNTDKARERFSLILEDACAAGKTAKATARMGLGMLDANAGSFVSALEHFEACKAAFITAGNDRLRAYAAGNLANIYFSTGDYPRFRALMEETILLDKRLGDLDDLAVSYNNSGYCHSRLGEHHEAIQYYGKLESIAIKTGNPRMLSLACSGLSDSLRKIGDPAAALDKAQKACAYAERLGACVEWAVGLRVLGDACLANAMPERAFVSFGRSIPLLEKFIEYADKEDLDQAKAGYIVARTLLDTKGPKQSSSES